MENNNKRNTIAIVGFILSFFTTITGLICSIIGLNKSKELNDGKGLSIAGIVISSIRLVLAVIVILFAFIFTGNKYKVYDPVKDIIEDNDEIRDIIENNDTNTDDPDYMNMTKEELLANGFKEFDLSTREIIQDTIYGRVSPLDDDVDSLKKYYLDSIVKTFELNNNVLNYYYDDGINDYSKIIENVKSIKYSSIDCSGILKIFVITENDGIYYIDLSMDNRKIGDPVPQFKKYDSKYTDVKRIYLRMLTCGASIDYLFTDEQNNYYDMSTGELISICNTGLTIIPNGEVYYNGEKQSISYKYGFHLQNNELYYFVSSDNYLYKDDIGDDIGSGPYLKKASESKIDKVLYDLNGNNPGTVVVFFENGEKRLLWDIDIELLLG